MPVFLQSSSRRRARPSPASCCCRCCSPPRSARSLSGRAISRTGRYKRFPLVGLAIMALGLLALSTLDARDLARPPIALLLAFFGLGFGLVSQVLTIAIQNAVDRRDLGIATASANLFRSLGGAIGVAPSAPCTRPASARPERLQGAGASDVVVARSIPRSLLRRAGRPARPARSSLALATRSRSGPAKEHPMPKVLLRSEESGGAVSRVENTVPAALGRPAAAHARLRRGVLRARGRADLPGRGRARHQARGRVRVRAARRRRTRSPTTATRPARYVLVITPAGFERYFARMEAEEARRAARVGAAADSRGHARRTEDRRIAALTYISES